MNILIVDTMHSSIFEMFREKGWAYTYQPQYDREQIIQNLPGFDGLIIRSKTKVNESLLSATKDLKFIARAGAGLDLIDVDYVQKMGIELFHAGTGNRDAVAEHALGMLLGLFNNLIKSDREVRSGVWDREGNRGVELMNKTVGIIGYGNNGMATAKRLSSFGCEVLAYDKYRDNYSDEFATAASVGEIQECADIISFHVPLTEETRFWMNESFINRVKNPFYLMHAEKLWIWSRWSTP